MVPWLPVAITSFLLLYLVSLFIYYYLMTVHRQQIKDPSTRKIPLSAHLSECAGNKDNYFTLFPFYKFPINATEQHRIIKEAEFIKKYKPKLNK